MFDSGDMKPNTQFSYGGEKNSLHGLHEAFLLDGSISEYKLHNCDTFQPFVKK